MPQGRKTPTSRTTGKTKAGAQSSHKTSSSSKSQPLTEATSERKSCEDTSAKTDQVSTKPAWINDVDRAHELLEENQIEAGISLLMKVLPEARQQGQNTSHLGYIYFRLGLHCDSEGQRADARKYLQLALDNYIVSEQHLFLARTYLWLAYSYIRESEYKVGLRNLKKAASLLVRFAGQSGAHADIIWVLEQIAVVSAKLGKPEQSISAFETFSQTILALTDSDAVARLASLLSDSLTSAATGSRAATLLSKIIKTQKDRFAAAVRPANREELDSETFHQQVVSERFRWLEDAETDEAKVWIKNQNDYSDAFFGTLLSRRKLSTRLCALSYISETVRAWAAGDRYFLLNRTQENYHDILFTTKKLQHFPKVLIDPNKMAGGVTINDYFVNWTGDRIAYGMNAAGSDWQTWKVKCIAEMVDEPDELTGIRYGQICWKPDSAGLYYCRYPSDEQGHLLESECPSVYYHKFGAMQAEDQLIYQAADEEYPVAWCSKDWLFILISFRDQVRQRILCRRISAPDDGLFCELPDMFGNHFTLVGESSDNAIIQTSKDSNNYKLVRYGLTDHSCVEIVAEESSVLLQTYPGDDDFIVTHHLKHASSKISIHKLDGGLHKNVVLDDLAYVSELNHSQDKKLFVTVQSFIEAPAIKLLDLVSGAFSTWRKSAVDFDSSKYTSRQVFCKSADGTTVPVFISYRKGLLRSGRRVPTLLTGYGGFQCCTTPTFQRDAAVWMELGGIYAVAVLRGGLEYGTEWYHNGSLRKKQNVFDDFIAAAELLVDRYTSPGRLGIKGGSNGGLLVAAALTQRPELFGAVAMANPVTDMVRFHKSMSGPNWVKDYGDPDDPEDFEVLYRYSPLHKIQAGTKYPATLIQVGLRDDRVSPAHGLKFAAALQSAQAGPAPILLKTYDFGHTHSSTPSWLTVDKLGFLAANVGLDLDFEPI